MFVYAKALGLCLPVMGGPAIPAAMFTESATYLQLPRITTMALTITAAPYRTGPVTAMVANLPEVATTYLAALYLRQADGSLQGPAPRCDATAAAALIATGAPGAASITFADWASSPESLNATGFLVSGHESRAPRWATCSAGAWMCAGGRGCECARVRRPALLPPPLPPQIVVYPAAFLITGACLAPGTVVPPNVLPWITLMEVARDDPPAPSVSSTQSPALTSTSTSSVLPAASIAAADATIAAASSAAEVFAACSSVLLALLAVAGAM